MAHLPVGVATDGGARGERDVLHVAQAAHVEATPARSHDGVSNLGRGGGLLEGGVEDVTVGVGGRW